MFANVELFQSDLRYLEPDVLVNDTVLLFEIRCVPVHDLIEASQQLTPAISLHVLSQAAGPLDSADVTRRYLITSLPEELQSRVAVLDTFFFNKEAIKRGNEQHYCKVCPCLTLAPFGCDCVMLISSNAAYLPFVMHITSG